MVSGLDDMEAAASPVEMIEEMGSTESLQITCSHEPDSLPDDGTRIGDGIAQSDIEDLCLLARSRTWRVPSVSQLLLSQFSCPTCPTLPPYPVPGMIGHAMQQAMRAMADEMDTRTHEQLAESVVLPAIIGAVSWGYEYKVMAASLMFMGPPKPYIANASALPNAVPFIDEFTEAAKQSGSFAELVVTFISGAKDAMDLRAVLAATVGKTEGELRSVRGVTPLLNDSNQLLGDTVGDPFDIDFALMTDDDRVEDVFRIGKAALGFGCAESFASGRLSLGALGPQRLRSAGATRA